jgi:tetratricopeptide (TPR) repeat protein
MILNWLDANKAVETGIALADQLAPWVIADPLHQNKLNAKTPIEALKDILATGDHRVRKVDLNFYKRAKLANSFKWRLIEKGVARNTADEVTQSLVLNLSVDPNETITNTDEKAQPSSGPTTAKSAKQLLANGNKCMAAGSYEQAIEIFCELLELDPRNAVAHNNLGSALSKLSRFQESEEYFLSAIKLRPDFVEAHWNLGLVQQWRGYFDDSEKSLRRALKLNPSHMGARISLGATLALTNRFREATGQFRKVLKVRPRDAEALFGMAQIAGMEGRFDESEKTLKQVVEIRPKMPAAWAALAGVRRMTTSDGAWLRKVEEFASSGIPPMEEATMRFAMGKYHDDVGQYHEAFKHYETANELLKPIAEPYDRHKRTSFVDNMIRVYTDRHLCGVTKGASESNKPVFVVGMLRSGTSLTEQIIASHPNAKGAGEVEYWRKVMSENETAIRLGHGRLDEAVNARIADDYLRILDKVSESALRIVDKAPLNSEYLGSIHSVFPNARIIYLRRDPVDTCLSCYFQNFSLAQGFTLDLSDLAHYYQEHHRLMSHWRAVLPKGVMLEVRYEQLVADQEGWTRKILEFLELEWSDVCLNFHATARPIVTASFWQARQKIFKTSVQRWRNYEKFVGPLRSLDKLDP